MTGRGSGNWIGLLSIPVSGLLWPLMLLGRSSGYDYAAPAGWLLALVLPIVAAAQGARLWLIMLASPLLLYAAIVTHFFER